MADEPTQDNYSLLLGGSIILLLLSGVMYVLTISPYPAIGSLFLMLFGLAGIGTFAGVFFYVLGFVMWALEHYKARKL